jgi:hypothetical protein
MIKPVYPGLKSRLNNRKPKRIRLFKQTAGGYFEKQKKEKRNQEEE